jgi:hypothetical protein
MSPQSTGAEVRNRHATLDEQPVGHVSGIRQSNPWTGSGRRR